MISIKKRFLFIHVEKTGGNSIQTVLKDYSEDVFDNIHDIGKGGKKQILDGVENFEVKNLKYGTIKHSRLRDYKRVLEQDVYEGLFKFSTIRNPWERMISCYFSPHRKGLPWDREEFIRVVKAAPTLSDCITLDSPLSKGIKNKIKRWIPLSEAKLDRDIDFLMRYEHLNEDFAQVCKKLILPVIQLPVIHKSNRQHYSHYYDEELIRIVEDKFCDEIDFGEYKFEKST
jgi:hypothetical protein